MRIYESTFILSPQADDATFDRQIKAVTDLIERNNGKTIQENRWGVRRLAYPIKKFTQGFYTRLIFEGNNQVLSELERFFKLEESYIRYLTVLFEGNLEERSPAEDILEAPIVREKEVDSDSSDDNSSETDDSDSESESELESDDNETEANL